MELQAIASALFEPLPAEMRASAADRYLVYLKGRDGRLDFASELKALLQLDDAPREIDPVSVSQYLTYQYVPHPRSILTGYAKLPPAHIATYQDGRLTVRRYWRPPY